MSPVSARVDAMAASTAAGSFVDALKNGHCHHTWRPMQASAISMAIQRREMTDSISASTARITNHGVADTITGMYGSACRSSGSMRRTLHANARAANMTDKTPRRRWRRPRGALVFATGLFFAVPDDAPDRRAAEP